MRRCSRGRCAKQKNPRFPGIFLSLEPSDGLERSTPSLPFSSETGSEGSAGHGDHESPGNRRIRRRRVNANGRACPRWCSLTVPSMTVGAGRSGHGWSTRRRSVERRAARREDRRIPPESPDRRVDAEEQLPEELGDDQERHAGLLPPVEERPRSRSEEMSSDQSELLGPTDSAMRGLPSTSIREGESRMLRSLRAKRCRYQARPRGDLLGLDSEKPGELPLEAQPRVLLDDALADCTGYLVAA